MYTNGYYNDARYNICVWFTRFKGHLLQSIEV